MNDAKQIEVKLIDMRAKRFIKSVVCFIDLFIAPIAIGILLNNTVMQWFGFIGFLFFVFLAMIGSIRALDEQKRDKLLAKKFTSIEDAIAYLETISQQPSKKQRDREDWLRGVVDAGTKNAR